MSKHARLSDAELVSRLKLVEKHGSASKAAVALGVAGSAFRDSVRMAKLRGLTAASKLANEEDKLRSKLKLVEADMATGGLLYEIVDVIERVDRSALPHGGGAFRQKQDKPRRPVAHRGRSQDKRSRRRN